MRCSRRAARFLAGAAIVISTVAALAAPAAAQTVSNTAPEVVPQRVDGNPDAVNFLILPPHPTDAVQWNVECTSPGLTSMSGSVAIPGSKLDILINGLSTAPYVLWTCEVYYADTLAVQGLRARFVLDVGTPGAGDGFHDAVDNDSPSDAVNVIRDYGLENAPIIIGVIGAIFLVGLTFYLVRRGLMKARGAMRL